MPQETQQKKLLNLLRVLGGKITLGPPLGIPAPSSDLQFKCFLHFRYETNFPSDHQKLDRSSTAKPLRSPTIIQLRLKEYCMSLFYGRVLLNSA